MILGCKSTTSSFSAVSMVFMALAATALLDPAPAAAATELDTRTALTSALILGEESLVSTALLVRQFQTYSNNYNNNVLCSCGCCWIGVLNRAILQLIVNWKQSALS